MTSIIIADDHALIREGVRNLLSHEPDLDVVGEAEDALGLIALVGSVEADVVVMDANMPGGDPLVTLQQMRTLRPGLPVLILSMLPEDQVAMGFIRAGAAGFMSKTSPPEELAVALRKVSNGGRYVSQALAEGIVLGRQSDRPSHETLSARELQVLRLIAAGKPVKTVARELSISISTVHTYRGRILQKLAMDSDVDLARYAVQHHLVE